MKRRKQAGFTLIEMIAVLVVLTILVSLAMPKYFSIQDEARKKAQYTSMAAAEKRDVAVHITPDASVRATDISERIQAGGAKTPVAGMERHPGR